GGAGLDHFLFDTVPNSSTNFDQITDFNPTDDAILLDRAVYGGIAADGVLPIAAFHAGAAAADASDRIIYNTANGNIFYDVDGAGGAAQVLFARVTPNTPITRSDFYADTAPPAAAPPPPAAFADARTADAVMLMATSAGWEMLTEIV
ncbi:MAG TPA: hypothetical protein VGW34_03295, partial [Allosphingosinicella sp.]|nr:hypothetical protein [Allosphingosinicella sp.]